MARMTVAHVGAKGTPCERVRNVIRWLTASHGCLKEPAGRVQEETSKSSEERRSEVGCLVTRGRQQGNAGRDALGDVSLLSLVCFSSNWHRPAPFSFLLLVACLHFSVLSFFLSCVHWEPRFPCFPLSVLFFSLYCIFCPDFVFTTYAFASLCTRSSRFSFCDALGSSFATVRRDAIDYR